MTNIDDVLIIEKNSPMRDQNGYYFLNYYIPYRNLDGSRNPAFTAFSGSILDLKQNKIRCDGPFLSQLNQIIKKNIPIAIVPSHDPDSSDSGLLTVAKKLVRDNRIDATSCLQRIKKIDKLSGGGDRSVEVHLNSIKVINIQIIVDQHVLLLDDVTTSGNSFGAGKQLLLEAGAYKVTCLAIGKTKRDN
jgi:predicted amidophosphoribosyltransferase